MVFSACHSIKAVVSEVGALQTGLQGLMVKAQCRLSATQAPQQPLAQLPTKGGWHRYLAKPARVVLRGLHAATSSPRPNIWQTVWKILLL